jgi:hypothetical protein
MDRVHFYFSLSHSFWIISVTISLTSLTPSLPLDSHPRTVAFLAGGAWREGEGGRCPFLLEVPAHSFSSPPVDSVPCCHPHTPANTLQHRHHCPIASPGRCHPPSFFSHSGGHPNLGQQGCVLSSSLYCGMR